MRSLIKKTRNGFGNGSGNRSNSGGGGGGGGSAGPLKIDTGAADSEHRALKKSGSRDVPATPPTTSTTASYPTPPPLSQVGGGAPLPISTPLNGDSTSSARGSRDVRSPGAKKTPVNKFASNDNDELDDEVDGEEQRLLSKQPQNATADDDENNVPLPDFITQTDRYGNSTAAAPPPPGARRPSGIQQSRLTPQATTQTSTENRVVTTTSSTTVVEVNDECGTDSIFDSLRVMCCCLLLDEPGGRATSDQPQGGNAIEAAKGGAADGSSQQDDVYRQKQAVSPAAVGPPEIRGLLPDCTHPDDVGKKCLVLDLDETLVHSSFRAVPGADFVIPVQVEDVVHAVYVAKRPYVDEFLLEMSKHYEIVVYTASLNKYADPLLDLLDVHRVIRFRLFRDSCVYHEGHYVKDLGLLNRELRSTIIVDNSPNSYIFHPENAIDCGSFIDDPNDRELEQIGEFLRGVRDVADVRHFCGLWRGWPDSAAELMSDPRKTNGSWIEDEELPQDVDAGGGVRTPQTSLD